MSHFPTTSEFFYKIKPVKLACLAKKSSTLAKINSKCINVFIQL